MDPVLRRAARLVVVDPSRRVFLFQHEDAGRTWWATPGGGVEGDETFEQAAAREAAEELGLAQPALTPLGTRTATFTFRGQDVRQEERFFLVRVDRAAVVTETIGDAHRREHIVGARWWSAEELVATAEQVFPEDLERLMA